MNIWVDDDFDFLALFSSQLGILWWTRLQIQYVKVSNDNNNETETTSESR